MPAIPQVLPAPGPPENSAILHAARHITGQLNAAGFQALFAGGFARDLLMGRPIHDIDIASDAEPDRVTSLFPDCRQFGKSFGVVQVTVDGFSFEVATFRRDLDYADGRHPGRVVYTTAGEDAQRRDFTINGMFYDPRTHTIIDYVDGISDLNRRIIRAIGDPDLRFAEDHLRIMRGIRFASVLAFAVEESTWAAIGRFAPRLTAISMERIRDEFMRTMMESRRPGEALRRMRDAGILAVILPEIEAMNGVAQPPEFHPEGDVFVHTALMLDTMVERSPALVWAILLHDVGKPPTFAMGIDKTGKPRIQFRGHAEVGADMAADILRRFRCSNDDVEAVTVAVRNHMRFAAVPEMRESTLRKWVGSPTFPLELELHRIDCASSHRDLTHHAFIEDFRDRLNKEPVLPKPLLGGRDLLAMGMTGGPDMGRVLKRLYDAQLEGAFADRDQALDWVREHVDQLAEIDERPADRPPRADHA